MLLKNFTFIFTATLFLFKDVSTLNQEIISEKTFIDLMKISLKFVQLTNTLAQRNTMH